MISCYIIPKINLSIVLSRLMGIIVGIFTG